MTSRFRAPLADGEVLAMPPLAEVDGLVERNRRRFQQAQLLGRPLPELREAAGRAVCSASFEYLEETGENFLDSPAIGPLIVSGHQPELFHPGVWVKNFALNGLARRHGLTPLNLIIDSDTAKSTTLRLPTWPGPTLPDDPTRVHLATIPFDHWTGEVPFEELPVRDETLFARVPERLSEEAGNWGFEPLLHAMWREANTTVSRGPLLGERLVRGRRGLEQRWGCHNLELPLSRLCGTEAFAVFAGAVLGDPAGFAAAYNDILRGYRKRHRVRSKNHPAPDLASDGDWTEAPFWAWQVGAGRREKLFVRRDAVRGVRLRAGREEWPSLPPVEDGTFVGEFRAMQAAGRKVRSRALMTTLFARLFLADVFIHGIGGGLYDELTDELMRTWFAVEPPEFVVLSATLRLPVPNYPMDEAAVRERERAARQLFWNPQRWLGASREPSCERLSAEKQTWIDRSPPSKAGRRERYFALRRLTEELRRFVELEKYRQVAEHGRVELAANGILRRRDYAFCLHPEATLRPLCERFL